MSYQVFKLHDMEVNRLISGASLFLSAPSPSPSSVMPTGPLLSVGRHCTKKWNPPERIVSPPLQSNAFMFWFICYISPLWVWLVQVNSAKNSEILTKFPEGRNMTFWFSHKNYHLVKCFIHCRMKWILLNKLEKETDKQTHQDRKRQRQTEKKRNKPVKEKWREEEWEEERKEK